MLTWIKEKITGRAASGEILTGPTKCKMTLPDHRLPYNKWVKQYQISRGWNPTVNKDQRMY